MPIQKITDENFEQKVLKNSKPFCLKFEATWCGAFSPSL
jgi:thioredoxin-like negative regulator of GroEL